MTQRHQPAFGAAGAALSVQSVHGNYWVQVDLLQAAAYPQQQYPQQQAGAGKLAGPSSGEPGFYPHPAAYAPPPVPGAVMPPPRVEYTPDSKPQ